MRALFAMMLLVGPVAGPLLAEVKLEAANFEKIEKAVAAHKGKVVVIDVWATFCAPCKAKFPHVVQLYKDHAKDGLVVISLSIDELEDRGKTLQFLTAQKAEFENFILDETEANKEKWDKTWPHSAPPQMMVFDRTGKLDKTFEGVKQTTNADAYIKELLKK
jgi:thiol-disulfide isomerase/thioredoxin